MTDRRSGRLQVFQLPGKSDFAFPAHPLWCV